MKAHGILFSGPMVRALLRPINPKGQTRRAGGLDAVNADPNAWRFVEFGNTVTGAPVARFQHRDGSWITFRVRHPVGTRLYVRETTALLRGMGTGNRVVYRADSEPVLDKHHGTPVPMKWTPSLLMPRSRARIFLDVTGVRVERAQAISDADVAAEGMDAEAVRALVEVATVKRRVEAGLADVMVETMRPAELWRAGWTLINGRASWDANPWVWVYGFKQSGATGAGDGR